MKKFTISIPSLNIHNRFNAIRNTVSGAIESLTTGVSVTVDTFEAIGREKRAVKAKEAAKAKAKKQRAKTAEQKAKIKAQIKKLKAKLSK